MERNNKKLSKIISCGIYGTSSTIKQEQVDEFIKTAPIAQCQDTNNVKNDKSRDNIII
jgi:hypothetical protein